MQDSKLVSTFKEKLSEEELDENGRYLLDGSSSKWLEEIYVEFDNENIYLARVIYLPRLPSPYSGEEMKIHKMKSSKK